MAEPSSLFAVILRAAASPRRRSSLRFGLAALAALTLAGCADGMRLAGPAIEALSGRAAIPSMPPETRAFDLSVDRDMQADFVRALVSSGPETSCDTDAAAVVHCVLIVSGGGGYGAYGAGVLAGWTDSGARPEFQVVTGVSTGAILAPFAFLGPEWDARMVEAYTTVEGDRDFLRQRDAIELINADSIFDTARFAERIARYVQADLLEAIAAEHEAGRRLYVGTTNLDAQRLTIWNMGAIAASGSPGALDLFRKVLRASASPPILAPPVFIDVEIDGAVFDEMHVDGGVQAQFFAPHEVVDIPTAFGMARDLGAEYTPQPRFYVIRNAKFQPEPRRVDRGLRAIGRRALSTMVLAMGRSDLDRLYSVARNLGADFFFTEIPSGFVWESEEEFDQEEMRRLFELGRRLGADQATLWRRQPPGVFARNAGLATAEAASAPDDQADGARP